MNEKPSSISQTLGQYLSAGYPALFIPTCEENRLECELRDLATRAKATLVTWDCYSAFSIGNTLSRDPAADQTRRGRTEQQLPPVIGDVPKYKNPRMALDAILRPELWQWATVNASEAELSGRAIIHLRDMDDFMIDPEVRRMIRTLCEENRVNNESGDFRPVILSSSKRAGLHEKLKNHVSVVEFALPDEAFIMQEIDGIATSATDMEGRPLAPPPEELRDQLTQCLKGLTSQEVGNCLARCVVIHGGFKPDMLGTIKSEKAAIVKKSEILTYIPEQTTASREDIGGFDNFFNWLDRRKLAYGKPARALKLDYPKGVILMGPPGTGKSYMAKATSRYLGLPGYILDMGAVFGSLVGESEQRMRDALRQIEAQDGCVLLVDEADKAIGNAHESQGDSGVTRRVFGHFLTWLAEKQDRTFVIMTLNRAQGMPPELLRAGRFDALFWTDLPTPEERRQIMEIHLRRRSVSAADLNYSNADWRMIAEKTHEFVGAELEEVVREARYRSFQNRESGHPTVEEMMQAANGIRPTAERDPDGLKAIREYCKNRAENVSSAIRNEIAPKAGGSSKRRVQASAADPGAN